MSSMQNGSLQSPVTAGRFLNNDTRSAEELRHQGYTSQTTPTEATATPAAPAEPSQLSEQVLRQKAHIQLQAAAREKATLKQETRESIAAEGIPKNSEIGGRTAFDDGDGTDDQDQDDEPQGLGPEETLQQLLENVTPCAAAYPVSLVQSTDRQRVDGSAERWTDVKGLRVLVRPSSDEDCVLLVANALLTPEADREESHWAINRLGFRISPKFSTFTRQRDWSHHVCIPWLDQPGKHSEQDYQVSANAGREQMHFAISGQRERRQLLAITLPAYQVSWVEDDEPLSLPVGPWRDVDGLYEVITTLPGERVLVICTMRYAAHWSSELNRGRFTLARDDVGLDGFADRGLQSVRALSPNLHRTLLMTTVDEPPPGPHLYRVRAALTAGTSTGVSATLEDQRQLALIRLPGNLVVGPMHVKEPIEIGEERWTEVPGLAVTISLKRPRDRVLLVYHTDCNPHSHFYEAHFTVFRRKEASAAPAQNLGFSNDFGLDMVFSDYAASSEYPNSLLCDTPGSLGTWTYYLCARVANMGTSKECPTATVGYSGSISAVLLTR
eukprot:TRINITY_DN11336_c0_g1_i1.p1 TRINITY_DN11336_c0_g1~~TRINITY_DN11336_c0_g1_i1.p1  ORF type:complete len:554 (+),score=85.47 TRINITY_DN11336_c0_g1_i1:63-1724(+)